MKTNNSPLTRQLIIDNYRAPENRGKPESFTHSHKLANRTCGDEIEVYLTIEDQHITKLNYEVKGCALSIAAASLISQDLPGLDIAQIKDLDENYIEELLETKLSIGRVKCGLLPLQAIQQAAELVEKKEGI